MAIVEKPFREPAALASGRQPKYGAAGSRSVLTSGALARRNTTGHRDLLSSRERRRMGAAGGSKSRRWR